MTGTAALPDPDRAGDTGAAAAEGDVLDGRYALRELIGEGGMSRVHLAHDRELDRLVAVKIVRSDDPDERARLRDEARAVAAIDHPGVVTVHDVGAGPGGVHIVMSYVAGETLARRLDREGPLQPDEVVRIGLAVCDALGTAHRAGIVHRDVTPGNIILGTAGRVTVVDFGIARIGEGAGRTRTGHVVGTPTYLAPEQGRATGTLDGRTDLYSLACTLFAALTGRPPFTGPDPFTVVLAHLREPPPPPSSLRAGVPPALEEVLVRTLAKDPALRPADADVLAAELASSVGAAAPGRARTREFPAGEPGAGDPPASPPAGRADSGAPGPHALEHTLADVENDDGERADRRRGAGLLLIALAVLLVLGVLVAVVALG